MTCHLRDRPFSPHDRPTDDPSGGASPPPSPPSVASACLCNTYRLHEAWQKNRYRRGCPPPKERGGVSQSHPWANSSPSSPYSMPPPLALACPLLACARPGCSDASCLDSADSGLARRTLRACVEKGHRVHALVQSPAACGSHPQNGQVVAQTWPTVLPAPPSLPPHARNDIGRVAQPIGVMLCRIQSRQRHVRGLAPEVPTQAGGCGPYVGSGQPLPAFTAPLSLPPSSPRRERRIVVTPRRHKRVS
jgi:hypothetical protein